MGFFSFDLGQGELVEKYLVAIDGGVQQYLSNLINLVDNQLEPSWNSPNKQAFITDWNDYCSALVTITQVGPNLVAGLKSEINFITQAEQVQF